MVGVEARSHCCGERITAVQVQTLVSVSSLLITVKRAELRQKSREQEKEQKEPKKQK